MAVYINCPQTMQPPILLSGIYGNLYIFKFMEIYMFSYFGREWVYFFSSDAPFHNSQPIHFLDFMIPLRDRIGWFTV